MPLCWIFLLKRRRALSNVSFSPTRTSANPGSPPQARGLVVLRRARGQPALTLPDGETRPRLAEHSRGSPSGQTFRQALDGGPPTVGRVLKWTCIVHAVRCELGYLPGADESGD